MKSVTLFLVILQGLLACVTGFKFVMGGDQNVPVCFIVEQPVDTEFHVEYELPEASEHLSALVSLTDSSTDKVNSQVAEGKEGVLSFSTKSSKRHNLCISTQGPTAKQVVFGMVVKIGHTDAFYEELASREHMDRLQLEVVRLNDQLAQILSEVDYMKDREVEFHDMTEGMDRNAQWWPMIQIAILLITGVFQVKHLKRFFQTKKLV